MKAITGPIGREAPIEPIAREARKGRNLVLAGRPGVGQSAVLEAVLDWLLVRQNSIVLHVREHQAKGQFLELARGLLESGLLKPSALELDAGLDALDPAALEWTQLKRSVNRPSIRDLTAAIVPALHAHRGWVLIAVDDPTAVTPTLVAFWLAGPDAAQLLVCASEKRKNVARLWWKLAEIDIPPLAPDATREIVATYIARRGLLIEAPGLFVGHVVKQSGGNPQAIADLLDDSGKERRVDQRTIREMQHAAGVQYLDFTPALIVALASVVGALSGHRHRRHRAVHLRRDAGGGGDLGPGVPVPGGGEGERAEWNGGRPAPVGSPRTRATPNRRRSARVALQCGLPISATNPEPGPICSIPCTNAGVSSPWSRPASGSRRTSSAGNGPGRAGCTKKSSPSAAASWSWEPDCFSCWRPARAFSFS